MATIFYNLFWFVVGVLDHEELFGSLKLGENEIDENQKDFIKKTILPCVSSDIATRPSFAWDNAFLTEPGLTFSKRYSTLFVNVHHIFFERIISTVLLLDHRTIYIKTPLIY